MQNQKIIVIDNGSRITRTGFSGDDFPIIQFNCVIGKQKNPQLYRLNKDKQFYLGKELQNKKYYLQLNYPLEHGIVQNWDNMIKIWKYCYDELKIQPKNHPCLLTQTSMSSKQQRQKTIQIMFEQMNVPAFYLANSSLLSLYAVGRITGIIVQSGDGTTRTMPIYQGYPIPYAIQRINFAGKDLTHYFNILLNEIGLNYKNADQLEIAYEIKQKQCYIALDYDAELQKYVKQKSLDKLYQLPDGQSIKLGNQKFRCPQALFKPQLNNKQFPGLHQLAYNTIFNCQVDVRRQLYYNIVLSGGNTLFPGTDKRLQKQIIQIAPKNAKIKVVASPDRILLTWIGGSIITSLSTFQNEWIKKSQYQQHGSAIIHKRNF